MLGLQSRVLGLCWGCSPSSPSTSYGPALGLRFFAGAAISGAGAVAPALATGLTLPVHQQNK